MIDQEKHELIDLRPLSTKKWFTFFIILMFLVGLVIVLGDKVPLFKRYEKISFLFAGMSIASTFFPLPIIPLLLWVSKYYNPYFAALVATIGTCLANLNDYHIFHFLYRLERVKKVQHMKFFQTGVRWFKKCPFLAILGINFIPVPIDVIRILAVSAGYKRRYFVLATFLGRFPRYLIITIIGHEFKPSTKIILIVLAVTVAIGAVRFLYSKIKNGIQAKKKAASVVNVTEDEIT